MRIGTNPNRNKINDDPGFFHQVVVPVYIPNAEGYFADGVRILKICIESLLRTIHGKTFVTIVDNGSSVEVADYLQQLRKNGQIHELVLTTNIGKLNAVLKGISGGNYDFVTVADCDAMFLNGWQQATYEVFRHFPKAGAVNPVPSPKSYRTYGSVILLDYLFSDKMKFTEVRDREALLNFAHSVDNPDFYNEHQLRHNLTLADGNFRAVIGAGHFLVTYRGEVFDKPVARYTNNKLGAERHLVDLPVVNMGLWRMSTENNYAYHMGNVHESWMDETLSVVNQEELEVERPSKIPLKPVGKWFALKNRFGTKLFNYKPFVRWFLRKKGLSDQAAMKF